MIHKIINNKFKILFISELLGWFFLLPMAYFRYWEVSFPLFILSTVISGFFGYVPHIAIPMLICWKEKTLKALYQERNTLVFMMCIVIILTFGFTFGKDYVVKIDDSLQKWAQEYKNSDNSQ